MQCFKQGYLIPEADQIAGRGQAGRSPTDDRHFADFFLGRQFRHRAASAQRKVGDKPFQTANGDRFPFYSADTELFALIFLGADPTADRRQIVILADDFIGGDIIAFFNFTDECGNINSNRAAITAGRVFALQAAGGFGFGGFFIITQGNFVKIMPANVGFLFRHFMFYLL